MLPESTPRETVKIPENLNSQHSWKDWIPLERIPTRTPRNEGSPEPSHRRERGLWGSHNRALGEPLRASNLGKRSSPEPSGREEGGVPPRLYTTSGVLGIAWQA